MLYSREETLEDRLVRILLRGPAPIKNLHAKTLLLERVSLRAVYKAVDALVQKGVLLKVGKNVFVDQEWSSLVRTSLSPVLPLLSPGEKVVYTFNSIEHLDAFWKTIALQIEEYNSDVAVFYIPHNCWAYIPERRASEDAYYSHFEREKKYGFFTLGGASNADLDFKRSYQNDFFQIDMRPIVKFSRRNHVSVLGDFITTTCVPKRAAEQIDSLYASGKSIQDILPDILKALRNSGNFRLVFEHNAYKAKKLRKQLSSNFHIKK